MIEFDCQTSDSLQNPALAGFLFAAAYLLAQDVPPLGFGVAGRTAIALASALQYRGDHIS